MNRIEVKMMQLKNENKKAFITYTTAGLPNLDKTKEIIHAQKEAGIDVIELGIPFSDPVADGPVIQNASYQSIQNGTTLRKIFTMMEDVRSEGNEVPIIFMMYFNSILFYGIESFVNRCIECGVDGLIVPDLPYEEQAQLQEVLDRQPDKAPILIQLVSPVSKQRIPMLLSNARGFVYCVSQMGVTGNGANFHKDITEYLKEVKQIAKVPVMMGFGIRTAADVEPVKEVIDGAIVGSHFIRLLEESNYSTDAVTKYISDFQKELNR